jgi:HK97 family phage portal protein
MGALNFLRNAASLFRPRPAPSQDDVLPVIRKALGDSMFSDSQDPLVANRYSTAELGDFLDLYSAHPWVYVCASSIAQAAASVKFEVKSNGETLKPDEVGQFMVRPNPHQTWFDLIETTMLHLELAGNSYWEVLRGTEGDGKVEAIFPLRPDRMKIIPDAKKKVAGYEYQVDGGAPIPFKPEQILHLKYTSAKDEFYGTPPISAGQSEVTLDFYMTGWNKRFFKEGAEPGGVLETEQVLSETTWNRMRTFWNKRHRGPNRTHEIAILEGGLTYKPVTSKHAEMQYLEGKKASRDVVLAIMRVPPIIVGLVDGVTYANSKDQKKIFWQHNIIPKLMRIQDAINAFLMPERVEFNFVTKMIDSIVEDDEVKAQISQANVAHGIMTINEVREKYYNLPAVPWGDVYWAPVGLAPVQDATAPTISPNLPGQGVTDAMTAGLKHPSQVPVLGKRTDLELEDTEKADLDPNDPVGVSDHRTWSLWKTQAGPDDRRLRATMQKWFREQGQRIAAELERAWPVQKADSDENESVVNDILLTLKEDDARLAEVLIPEAERVLEKYGAGLLAEMKSPKDFALDNPEVQKFLERYAAGRVRGINDTTRTILRNSLVKAFENREGVKDVLGRVRNVFDGNVSAARARNIARTELVTLVNNARHEGARQSGVVKKKRWICEQLPTSRKQHSGMHGKVVDFDAKFEVPTRKGGVELMDAPGDMSAGADNVCGCLCIVGYFSGTEEFADIILGDNA